MAIVNMHSCVALVIPSGEESCNLKQKKEFADGAS